jgi:hypothetical protein
MKKLIISCIISLIGVCSTSQAAPVQIQIGPRVGIGGTKLMLDLEASKKGDYKTDMGFAWHAGIVSRLDFSYVYVQPEVLFTNSEGAYHFQGSKYTLHYRKLNIPVMVGLKLQGLIRLQAGPTFSVLLSAKEGEDDIAVNYSNLIAGWQAGIGVDLGPLMIDLVYEGNLSKFGKKLGKMGIDVDHRQGLLKLSIGLDVIPLIQTEY